MGRYLSIANLIHTIANEHHRNSNVYLLESGIDSDLLVSIV